MSDRLALADAIERAKAEQLAATIFDGIRDNIATKADPKACHGDLLLKLANPTCRPSSTATSSQQRC
jgi:hypothetical protein